MYVIYPFCWIKIANTLSITVHWDRFRNQLCKSYGGDEDDEYIFYHILTKEIKAKDKATEDEKMANMKWNKLMAQREHRQGFYRVLLFNYIHFDELTAQNLLDVLPEIIQKYTETINVEEIKTILNDLDRESLMSAISKPNDKEFAELFKKSRIHPSAIQNTYDFIKQQSQNTKSERNEINYLYIDDIKQCSAINTKIISSKLYDHKSDGTREPTSYFNVNNPEGNGEIPLSWSLIEDVEECDHDQKLYLVKEALKEIDDPELNGLGDTIIESIKNPKLNEKQKQMISSIEMKLQDVLNRMDIKSIFQTDWKPIEGIIEIEQCNTEELIYILKHDSFILTNHKDALMAVQDDIISYFQKQKMTGTKLKALKRNGFANKMVELMNNNSKIRGPTATLFNKLTDFQFRDKHEERRRNKDTFLACFEHYKFTGKEIIKMSAKAFESYATRFAESKQLKESFNRMYPKFRTLQAEMIKAKTQRQGFPLHIYKSVK